MEAILAIIVIIVGIAFSAIGLKLQRVAVTSPQTGRLYDLRWRSLCASIGGGIMTGLGILVLARTLIT